MTGEKPNPDILIPDDELEFRASRAGGPGGQHVNTSSTRVEVRWNVARSRVVSDRERGLIRARLRTRVDAAGWIRVVSAETRSQAQNRDAAARRLHELVNRALVVPKPRKATKIPRGAKERRLSEKRRRGEVKRARGPIRDDER
jgi:ribosome-associated protein